MWLLTAVCQHVLVEGALLTKTFSTFGALVWFLTKVNLLVNVQSRLLNIGFSTSWFNTLVWLLTAVRQHVAVEGVLSTKTFSTLRARVWFFARFFVRFGIVLLFKGICRLKGVFCAVKGNCKEGRIVTHEVLLLQASRHNLTYDCNILAINSSIQVNNMQNR